ncbi:hypothetical protein KG090_00645 [Carnobacteriaceae bacterium zg-ZUI240]|nr:hypothetical protein [Carnobacteriaceae bacterium zg-ZUI240]
MPNFNGNFRLYINTRTETLWQNVQNNQSGIRVHVTLGIHSGWNIDFRNTYGSYFDVFVDGQWQALYVNQIVLDSNSTNVGYVDFTVTHNGDGTKQAVVKVQSQFKGIAYGSYYSGQVVDQFVHTFATIPRASDFTLPASVDFGKPFTINIFKKHEAFRHDVSISFADIKVQPAKKVDTTSTYTVPFEWMRKVTNATSSRATVFVDTFSGNTKIATTSKTITFNVPQNVKPTLNSLSINESSEKVKSIMKNQAFVQVMSRPTVHFLGASGAYGSTITEYHSEIVGKNLHFNGNGVSFGVLNFNGTVTVRAYVVDSRGRRSDTVSQQINVLEYYAPIIAFNVQRGGSDNQSLIVNRSVKIAPLNISGVQKNIMKLTYRTAEKGGNPVMNKTETFASFSQLVARDITLDGVFAGDKTYQVFVKVEDVFNVAEVVNSVGTEQFPLSVYPNGIGVNKVVERGALDVRGDSYFEGRVIVDDKPIQEHQLTYRNGTSLSLSNVDLNTITSNGFFYALTSNYAAHNFPSYKNGYLEVQMHPSKKYGTQRFTEHTQSGKVHYRNMNDGQWGAWQSLASGATNEQSWQKIWNGTDNVQGVWIRRVGELVYMRGHVKGNGGNISLGTIPVSMRPYNGGNAITLIRTAVSFGDNILDDRKFTINAQGQIQILKTAPSAFYSISETWST